MRSNVVRRALDAEVAAARHRLGRLPAVLDVGGGSGVWAVPLATAGCSVTVVDPSPDALAVLRRRAAGAGCGDRITGIQGDTDVLADVVPAASADLVLAHDVLEIVDDPATATAALTAATAPGGAVSVLVANRFAAVLARVLAGRLVEASQLLAAPDGRLPDGDPAQPAGPVTHPVTHDAPLRRMDVQRLRAVLEHAGLVVESVCGDGVFSELVPGAVLDAAPAAAGALAELERLAATTEPLRDIATRLHAIARRPVS